MGEGLLTGSSRTQKLPLRTRWGIMEAATLELFAWCAGSSRGQRVFPLWFDGSQSPIPAASCFCLFREGPPFSAFPGMWSCLPLVLPSLFTVSCKAPFNLEGSVALHYLNQCHHCNRIAWPVPLCDMLCVFIMTCPHKTIASRVKEQHTLLGRAHNPW